jgi:receptor protein-tyrosine kinase
MNVATINRLPNMFEAIGLGKKRREGQVRLSRKQRDAIRGTRRVWLEMALRIINSAQPSVPMVLGITSSSRGEGKTTNCIGIGAALSRETDERVLVLECDLIEPAMAVQLNMEGSPGLTECIQGYSSLEDIVQGTPVPNLDIVFAGGTKTEKHEMDVLEQPNLSSLRRRLPGILTVFSQTYKFIVIDMPPVLNSPYTRDIIKYTDGTFLTVKAGVTSTENLTHAAELVSEDKLSGVILLGADSPMPKWLIGLLQG